MRRFAPILGLAALLPGAAAALQLELPQSARQLAQEPSEVMRFELPVAPLADASIQTRPVEAIVNTSSWSFPIGSKSTGDIMGDFRAQLAGLGYAPLLDCFDQRCGGYDFRYAIQTLPEPDMHIDLGDFKFLTAFKIVDAETTNYLQLIVSRSAKKAYVQVTALSPKPESELITATKTPLATMVGTKIAPGDVGAELLELGFTSLRDLSFEIGSSNLAGETFASLDALGAFLTENTDITIALVGHTDAQGSLSANIALSKRRAGSVLERLVRDYGIARNRLEAEGVGYLAPIGNNLSEEGRAKNRRVEVVITSTR